MEGNLVVKSASEFGGEAVIWGVSEDEGLELLPEPFSDDGGPLFDPWLDVIEQVASDEPQEGVFSGDCSSEGGTWFAGLRDHFDGVGGWFGIEGSGVEVDPVDVEFGEQLDELLFAGTGIEPVVMSDFEGPGEMFGELSECGFEDFDFSGREVGGQLEEGGSEGVGFEEDFGGADEGDEFFCSVAKPSFVSDSAGNFEAEAKAGLYRVSPAADSFGWGECVEGAVGFDGQENG